MIKACVVSIGNELLNGHTTDTNCSYICGRLLSIGIPVVNAYTVGDDIKQIVRSLKRAAEDADIVIVTGGLGPTDDDITRQAFAELMGVKLQVKPALLKDIRKFFADRGLPMPENNTIQACVPKGASVLENPFGTAPGIFAKMKRKLFFAMPGVPVEMKEMLEKSVLSRLAKKGAGGFTIVKKVRCFGAGESALAEKLGDLMDRDRNPLINSTVNSGVITLHVVASARTKKQAEQMAQKDINRLRSLLGNLIFGFDDQTLPEVVGHWLMQHRKTITVAESCTGGLLTKLITDIPGASEYFTHGWITYSNRAKTELLGVPKKLIEKHGAVSEQAASAMAIAARQKAKSDFAVAITGIAGPAGGSRQKPVGLVYISVCDGDDCQTKKCLFSYTRELIRVRAALTALNMLRLWSSRVQRLKP
ncbi:MAG: competence/damage-inducible protein A [Sedimentisphaerales bacterium]|jgi:nicotinamide-nucleotide amidase